VPLRQGQLLGADVAHPGTGLREQLEFAVECVGHPGDPRLATVQLDADALATADAVAEREQGRSHATRTTLSVSRCAARKPATVAAHS
jgi:hypothetical protein